MRRIRIAAGYTELAGRPVEEVAGADGIEVGPDGEELRQIVQDRLTWEYNTWVSREGTVYDRVYDPFRRSFVWSLPRVVGVDAATGHYTTVVGRESDVKKTMRLIRAIALAWIDPPRMRVKLQACVVPGAVPIAENIVWVRTGVREFTLDGIQEIPRATPFAHDTWRPLRYVWRNLCGERVHSIDESMSEAGQRYEVSLRGWVRTPHGTDTRGICASNGRMYASIAGVGAFWVDEAVLCSFGNPPPDDPVANTIATPNHLNGDLSDNTASNLRWARYVLSLPRHEETLGALSEGLDVACERLGGIRRSTLWDRISTLVSELPYARVRQDVKFVAPDAVRLLLRRKMEDAQLDSADTISTCVQACDDALPDNELWSGMHMHDKYGVVRCARCLLIRQRLLAGNA